MKVSFAFGMGAHDLQEFVKLVRLAEQVGFDAVTTGDNPRHIRDQYVALTLLALNTSRCRIGNSVTNPTTRSPLVTATAMWSIDDLAPGRVFLGMGTGIKGTRAELEDYLRAVREIWTTGVTIYKGVKLPVGWRKRPLPIVLAASGPKGLQQAGRLADGVIVEAGLTPEIIAQVHEHIARGAREAGRDPDSIEIWWYAKAEVAESRDAAIDRILGSLASSGMRIPATGIVDGAAPAGLMDKVATLRREYRGAEHFQTSVQGHNAQLVARLGIRDYLADRFGLVGSPSECVARVKQLAGYGVRSIFMAGIMPDKERFITMMGQGVLPAFRD